MLVKEFIAAAYPEDLEISIRANATIDRYGNNPMYFGKIKDFGKEKFHGYIGDLEVAGFFCLLNLRTIKDLLIYTIS